MIRVVASVVLVVVWVVLVVVSFVVVVACHYHHVGNHHQDHHHHQEVVEVFFLLSLNPGSRIVSLFTYIFKKLFLMARQLDKPTTRQAKSFFSAACLRKDGHRAELKEKAECYHCSASNIRGASGKGG